MAFLSMAAWIWAGLATIGALAAAIVRFRSDADETTAELWKGEAEAYKAKAERLEAALLSLEKRVEHLEAENRTLRAIHDSREEMIALRSTITEGFNDLKTILKEVR